MALPTNSKTPPPSSKAAGCDLPRFLPETTIEQLMAQQGIAGPQDLDALIGSGADLWDSDEEFERFQAWLRESRREGR